MLVCAAEIDATAPFRSDRILIKPAPAEGRVRLQSTRGYRVLRHFSDIGWQVIGLPPGVQVSDALAHYRATGLASVAEPDYLVTGTGAPDDPFFANGHQWGLHNAGQDGGQIDADIDAPEAWEVTAGARPVTVAVVDTGIRYTHEDLAANMWVNSREIPNNKIDDDGNGVVDDVYGFNALARNGDPKDDNGHGTHVAGILGAVANNGKGIAGVASNVRIMACKFLDSSNRGAVSDAIECIHYARKNGAQIINASWEIGMRSSALQTAIAATRDAGILFVTAAGNETQNLDLLPRYPVCYTLDNIVSVASITRAGLFDAGYSNYGKSSVDLTAPGAAIFSTWFASDTSYRYMSGTSMATPHVTGALALLRGLYPNEDYKPLISRLLAATDPLPGLADKTVSGGSLNLRKALGAPELPVVSPKVTPPAPAPAPAPVELAVQPDAGSANIRLSGSPGQLYVLQVSTNFQDWTSISTNALPASGSVVVSDDARVNLPQRYYRALSLPEEPPQASE